MPRIFDNINHILLDSLIQTLQKAQRADFCVGYFNLRGWQQLDQPIESWSGGENHCCRVLIGMQPLPRESLLKWHGFRKTEQSIDNQTAIALKKQLVAEFTQQLTIGTPTNRDEQALRRLVTQLQRQQVIVKLFLRHPLHAKLYLLFRDDRDNPITGYLGSSNLTLAGLAKQGELNMDVLDHDACHKLSQWFEARWQDRFCLDISKELIQIIQESWAREQIIPPYHIYIKMAYHLSQEARAGLSEFEVPAIFGNQLFKFQVEAVKIAAHHLQKRGGAIIGDVVGLGKTLMATAVLRLFEEQGFTTLILCPPNLVSLWESYCRQYELHAHILPLSQVNELAKLRRFRFIVIDESHNLRNREGKRYQAIQDYVQQNESKVLLLSATPYNKSYQDLANQLRLFLNEEQNLGIRPEVLLRKECHSDLHEFQKQYQCDIHSLSAFENSDYADDWRELMRLYMVRRTRSFIKQYYAKTDRFGKKYLLFENGNLSYFPTRQPKTIRLPQSAQDPYTQLYADEVVEMINHLNLPRYGLGNYIKPLPTPVPTTEEERLLKNLSRSGKRLMGFCRTNLFKRLESSGQSFYLSIQRHILRNAIYLYAIENHLPLPIGSQDASLLDDIDEDIDAEGVETEISPENYFTSKMLQQRASQIYDSYQETKKFDWLSAQLLIPTLAEHLQADNQALLDLLQQVGKWNAAQDTKLQALTQLLTKTHAQEKVLVFTQFADTANYLYQHLHGKIEQLAVATGSSPDPTALAWRFSPMSNQQDTEEPIRVLITTDVLSEGQNLQDCAVIVNYDLPWAIIRLIQRAGRVDRIGQQAETIVCYSFLPADGVERIIQLRAKVRQRLQESADVLGTDEQFFEDEQQTQQLHHLYNETAGVLDEDEGEVDLASRAYSIWKNAIERSPALERIISQLPASVHATKTAQSVTPGVLLYLRTTEGNDALAYFDQQGNRVTESQVEILNLAECAINEEGLARADWHHELVQRGVDLILTEEQRIGGQLGKPSSPRHRVYNRLKMYANNRGNLFDALEQAIEQIYQYPLKTNATDLLRQHLRFGISDARLAEVVLGLYQEQRLCMTAGETEQQEPLII